MAETKATINISVTDPDGNPVAGATVMVFTPSRNLRRYFKTGPDGRIVVTADSDDVKGIIDSGMKPVATLVAVPEPYKLPEQNPPVPVGELKSGSNMQVQFLVQAPPAVPAPPKQDKSDNTIYWVLGLAVAGVGGYFLWQKFGQQTDDYEGELLEPPEEGLPALVDRTPRLEPVAARFRRSRRHK